MKNKKRKRIMPQMFDVRPVDREGNLDFEKINRVKGVLKIEFEVFEEKITDEIPKGVTAYQMGKAFNSESLPLVHQSDFQYDPVPQKILPREKEKNVREKKSEKDLISLDEILFTRYLSRLNFRKSLISFGIASAIIFFVVFGAGFVNRGLGIKNSVIQNGEEAYASLTQAKEGMMSRDFQKSSLEFNEAYAQFSKISSDLNGMGNFLVEASRFIPYLSRLSSGAHLAEAGQDISRVGVLSGELMENLSHIKNPLSENESVSLLKLFQDNIEKVKEIQRLLADAKENLEKVNLDDIPEEKRIQLASLQDKLPPIENFISAFSQNSQIFVDVLGGNGPRKYLFLFQNNQEMRATGGFIGSYGILDIFEGRIRKFFVDGIFNPDGQLREKVVPPAPIQKISAAWSLHDSNWFPDFPISAEKAMWFYEKTGGPTVDGVIAMTPTVMQKLLAITGPIELPEYGVTVDENNFIEKIQYEVEIDYDKDLNNPKKILSDLAPAILDKLFNAKNFSDVAKTMSVLAESLDEKQILIYSKNFDIEKKLSALDWSGEILNTDKDYISVINSNINGFKTDGVVGEKIEHIAEIQEDGSVIDTVTITRHHNGGNMEYDWWNKVNADYMRVYVPRGSQLLSAEGQTREFNSPPLDYNSLNFKRDPQVEMEEDSIKIDEASGTRVYDEDDKTVFANWAYVSPQETVTIKYKYLLPFKIYMNGTTKPADTYSLLAQKQSGSAGSEFVSSVRYPDKYKMIWKYPDGIPNDENKLVFSTDLKTDKFFGAAFLPR